MSLIPLKRPYAVARGFFTQGQGNPDESRASRHILKDYVAGKLLYCHPPPNGIDADEFNEEMHDLDRLRRLGRVRTRRAPMTRVGRNADTFIPIAESSVQPSSNAQSHRARALDWQFFNQNLIDGLPGSVHRARTVQFPNQKRIGNDGHPAAEGSSVELPQAILSKKHFKAGKKKTPRGEPNYDAV